MARANCSVGVGAQAANGPSLSLTSLRGFCELIVPRHLVYLLHQSRERLPIIFIAPMTSYFIATVL